jgi:alanine racemase
MKHQYSYEEIFKTRPTKVEINLKNLCHNLSVVKNIVGEKKIMGIVKANAYGHGIVEVSKVLEKENIDYLGVAYIEEGILLRKKNINTSILVLGAVNSWQIKDFFKYDIQFSVSSLEKASEISKTAKDLNTTAKVHLKIDTGMGRIGIQWDRVKSFFKELLKLGNLNISGIFTHFSSAENDIKYTELQAKRFEKVLEELSKYIDIKDVLIHMANSPAIGNRIESSFKDMVRPGLLLYGYSHNKDIQKLLRPVMTFKTVVSYFKVLEKGSSISYGRKYITKKQTRIVTLPVGYADGYIKEFSNKALIFLNGNKYPIVGSVCMDQCMVDINNGEAFVGDDVELWGENIILWELCKLSNKTPYNLLTGISSRVPRRFIEC